MRFWTRLNRGYGKGIAGSKGRPAALGCGVQAAEGPVSTNVGPVTRARGFC